MSQFSNENWAMPLFGHWSNQAIEHGAPLRFIDNDSHKADNLPDLLGKRNEEQTPYRYEDCPFATPASANRKLEAMHPIVQAAICPCKCCEKSVCALVLGVDEGDPARSRRMAVPANDRSKCPAPNARPARQGRYRNIRYPVEAACFETPGAADQGDGGVALDTDKLDAVLGVQDMVEPRLIERPELLVESLVLEPALDPWPILRSNLSQLHKRLCLP